MSRRHDKSTTRELDSFVRIEQPVADESFDGAGSGSWALVAEVWAGVVDILPSRGESLAEGINMNRQPARVRIRARADVTTAMRIVHGDRIMQIVAGPAELTGRPPRQEFMVEDYRPAGNPA